MGRNISLTAPGIRSAFRRRCIGRGEFIRAVSNPVNLSIWRLAWKVRRRVAGFFIALFPRPGGGTTLFSREATCFSSGRKNAFASGAPRTIIPCGRSSLWTSYGRSRRLGIRLAYKRTPDVRSLMRCVPSSRALVWEATFGILSRLVSVNGFAPLGVSAMSQCNQLLRFLLFGVHLLILPTQLFQNVKCLDATPFAFSLFANLNQD